jgi:hypothetical protein
MPSVQIDPVNRILFILTTALILVLARPARGDGSITVAALVEHQENS